MKKVLVLGGGGFIGRNIVRFLLERGDCDVTSADISHSRGWNDLLDDMEVGNRFHVVTDDFTTNAAFDRLGGGFDQVYMMSAIVGVNRTLEEPEEVIRVNTLLTMQTLNWIGKNPIKRLLFASSSENYAGTTDAFDVPVPTPETVPVCIMDVRHPRFTYAMTKIHGECAYLHSASHLGYECVVVRYQNIIGPNMGFRHAIPHIVQRFVVSEASPFKIYGKDQTRAFCFIDDAVDGLLVSAKYGSKGEIYHIGTDDEISIKELANVLAQSLGIHVGVTATCLEEAKAIQELGADFIVAQGIEAGGHRGTFSVEGEGDSKLSTFQLLKVLKDESMLPIICAGGIMTGSDIVAYLNSGAAAVQMGTSFLCCHEAGTTPIHKKYILEKRHRETVYTQGFSGRWAQSIRNEFTSLMEGKPVLSFPLQNTLTSALRKLAVQSENGEYQSLWAGRGFGKARALPAAELISELISEISFLFLSKTPSTSVIKSNLLELNDFAIAPAVISAFILYGFLFSPMPIGTITGTSFFFIISKSISFFIFFGLPTNPKSFCSGTTSIILFFLTVIACTLQPQLINFSIISEFNSDKASSTTLIVFSSVTLKPSTNFVEIFCSSNFFFIFFPPP